MAAVTLAGALKGIEEGCDPGPAAEGNSYNGDHVSDLPRTWLEAIDRLEGSSFIRDVFGPSLHQGFVSIKRAEYQRLALEVSEAEWGLYGFAV